jgi:hypothetical protein
LKQLIEKQAGLGLTAVMMTIIQENHQQFIVNMLTVGSNSLLHQPWFYTSI